MKRLLLAATTLLCCIGLHAQAPQPRLTLDHSEHSFGTIKARGGEKTHTFTITNEGNAPLVITSVETSCSCTKASFDRRPLAPGASSRIVITYNPRRQNGTFYKAIQVYSNDPARRTIIVVQGEVVPGK